MTFAQVGRGWQVHAGLRLAVPFGSGKLWEGMRRIERFATLDAFHRRFELAGEAQSGTAVRIVHGLGLLRLTRVGRILRWREGSGYSFSDLSQRGNTRGFPHTYTYSIVPLSAFASELRIDVRGRWTARWIPRTGARVWLWWVMALSRCVLQIGLWRWHRGGRL